MNKFRNLLRALVIGLSVVGLVAPAAQAFPLLLGQDRNGDRAMSRDTMPVANDCYAIGQQQAAQVGGQLARATPENRGGRTVCVIVILLPAKDGQRPRRTEMVVPLG